MPAKSLSVARCFISFIHEPNCSLSSDTNNTLSKDGKQDLTADVKAACSFLLKDMVSNKEYSLSSMMANPLF